MSDRKKTIIRAPRNRDNPYFALRRKSAQDTRLSFEARGALSYLLSKPGDWDINLADLMREGGCGRDRALRILKELESCGYLSKEEQTRDDLHRFNPVVLVLHEMPLTEKPVTASAEPSTENPSTGEPSTAEPSTENPTHTDKRSTEVEESQNQEDRSLSPTTTESVPPAGENAPPPDDVVVDDEDREVWELIRTELAALCLTPVMDRALRALGPEAALAVAMAADQPGVKSPGGLAVSLINDPANIPLALVEKAGQLIERRLELAHPAPLPTLEERRIEHERLKAEAREIAEKRLEENPMLFASYSEPPEQDDEMTPDEGKNDIMSKSAAVDEMAQWRARWASLRDEFEIPRTAVPHQVIDEVLCVYCTSRNGEFERLRGRLDEITARLTAMAGKSVRIELENIQAMRAGVKR